MYFYSDGPAFDNQSKKAVDSCRRIFFEYYPEHPKSMTFCPDVNLGCRNGMVSALTWFFTQVDFGIVLEDDCLPSYDFFLYVHQNAHLLNERADIFCISGTKNIGSPVITHKLSSFPFIWGWASSSANWLRYKLNFEDGFELARNKAREIYSNPAKPRWIYSLFLRIRFICFWSILFRIAGSGLVDTWDYSLIATLWREKQKCLVPNANMIINLGFGELATHTTGKRPSWVPTTYSSFDNNLEPNLDYNFANLDRWSNEKIYKASFSGAFRLLVILVRDRVRKH